MSDFFSCKDSTGRYIFNIFFFSTIGSLVIFLLALAGYLIYKRHKKAKKRDRLFKSRSNTNNTNTNSTVLSGGSTSGQIPATSNFILGRPPATDVVLGVYGDEISKSARTAFYEEKGWRGFAYWSQTASEMAETQFAFLSSKTLGSRQANNGCVRLSERYF